MSKTVAVVGGGVTGLAAAGALNQLGYRVVLFEMEEMPGGHAGKWDRLFPSGRRAVEVVDELRSALSDQTNVMTGVEIITADFVGGQFRLYEASGLAGTADALLLAAGFELFDSRKKEEYGYGIYENVITSADLEMMFTQYGKPRKADGSDPAKVAFIHCVGSRDEKVNKPYCSKVCCVTAVKQAIEVREALPGCEVYNFYMDLRMFGTGYEQLYKEAQVKGVNFIRGRLSETSETRAGTIIIKAEDTLASKPVQLTADLVVLMAGMSPAKATRSLLQSLNLKANTDGFAHGDNPHTGATSTSVPGVFLAGAFTGPANITDSVNGARAAALQIHHHLGGDFKRNNHVNGFIPDRNG